MSKVSDLELLNNYKLEYLSRKDFFKNDILLLSNSIDTEFKDLLTKIIAFREVLYKSQFDRNIISKNRKLKSAAYEDIHNRINQLVNIYHFNTDSILNNKNIFDLMDLFDIYFQVRDNLNLKTSKVVINSKYYPNNKLLKLITDYTDAFWNEYNVWINEFKKSYNIDKLQKDILRDGDALLKDYYFRCGMK